jgi:hypothetical protein
MFQELKGGKEAVPIMFLKRKEKEEKERKEKRKTLKILKLSLGAVSFSESSQVYLGLRAKCRIFAQF